MQKRDIATATVLGEDACTSSACLASLESSRHWGGAVTCETKRRMLWQWEKAVSEI